MILDKKIEVTIINHNIQHYKDLGFDVKCKDKIFVKPQELTSGSHCKVNCSCDECGYETFIKYQDYLKAFNKNQKYTCEKCRQIEFSNFNNTKKQLMKTNRITAVKKKYGVDNMFQVEFVKEKMKETFIKKYGVEHPSQNEVVKERLKQNRIKNGTQVSDDNLSDYEKYRKKVSYYTRKYKKELYNNWNGLDYYDNELIIENRKYNFNDERYLTIDHKISVKKGFENNIEPIVIGNINNLCITKRCNNSSKGSLYDIPKRLKN